MPVRDFWKQDKDCYGNKNFEFPIIFKKNPLQNKKFEFPFFLKKKSNNRPLVYWWSWFWGLGLWLNLSQTFDSAWLWTSKILMTHILGSFYVQIFGKLLGHWKYADDPS